MARAKMSGFGRRVTAVRDGFASDSQAFAVMAEREARAILAETERVSETPLSRGIYMRARDLWAAPGASDALAESLAAFVGTTFPGEVCRCTQEHHWSSERGYFDCGGIVPA